jgi:tRNA nucleotidyltransferase (CCA-adding enzyme)
MPAVSTANWQAAYDCLSSLISNESPESVYKLLVRSEEANDLTWFLAALAPWAILGSPAITKIGGKQPFPYATLVAREGIKANNRLCDVVTGAARHIEDISKFKDEVLGGKSFEHERDILGMKIREWETNGGHWRVQVVLAIMIEAMKTDVSSGESAGFDLVDLCSWLTDRVGYGSLFGGWQKFLDHVVDIDLLEAASCKRLIDGTQLAKALDARPGRWMATALDVCMAWQFRNPGVTDLDGAIKEVRARARELEIPIQ